MRAATIRFTRLALKMTFVLAVASLDGRANAAAQVDPMPLGRTVSAPTGFVQFCQRRPDQCQRSAPIGADDHDADRDRAVAGGGATGLDIAAGLAISIRPLTDQMGDAPASLSALPALAADPDYLPNSFIADDAAPLPSVMSVIDPSVGEVLSARPLARASYGETPEGAIGGRLRYSPELAAEIGAVNVAINRAIKPRTDMEAFGIDNYWTLPLSDGPRAEGNCKHYALEKRRQLVDDGVPSNALSLAILVTPKGEVHAVLIVSTDQGDVVMDNLTDEIRPWRQTDYRWLVRQTPGDPLHWVEVGRGS